MTDDHATFKPYRYRALVTFFAMTGTIMQALDTTIANVALPHMQGSLSASLDQVNWVMTSYIVAAAIATAPVAWLSNRFGRKRLFIICVIGFTVASALCGISQNITQIVLSRLLQGVFGAALVPLSQATMLDSYSLKERGQAMAIWGMGIMVGPIMGPTLGAWLTEDFNWHWVFFINVPIGIITALGLAFFMEPTPSRSGMKMDWIGFAALSAGIGALQLMFDRGEQLDWFQSPEIVAEAVIAATGFYFFFAHSLTTSNPFVNFKVFRDRNFLISLILTLSVAMTLYSTLALVSPFLQNVAGYPVLDAGLLLASRGGGTLLAMMFVGRALNHIEARIILFVGYVASAITLYQMSLFTPDTSGMTIVLVNFLQGIAIGLVFVPLSTVSFMSITSELRTDAAALTTLLRNIGGSLGISIAIANLTRETAVTHARLAEFITPFRAPLQMPDVSGVLDLTTDAGRAIAEQLLAREAAIIAFSHDYLFIMLFTLASLPFVLMVGSTKALRDLQRRPSGDGKPAESSMADAAHA